MHRNLILNKVNSLLDATDNSAERALISLCDAAHRVYVSGAGRSRLVGNFFAMRLMQLGYKTSVVGEIVTPSIKSGDVLVIVSGSGETEQLKSFTKKARSVGAKIVLISSKSKSTIGDMVDLTIQIGAQELYTPVKGMPMGTMFELSALIFFESLVSHMIHEKDITEEVMQARHANIE